MKSRIWLRLVLAAVIVCLCSVALLNFIIDPVFHYRKPTRNYSLFNERYQNDGIEKHFDYDAMIVGTSMTENFKSSEADSIFGVTSIKTPYSGASYKEINDAVATAVKNNDALKLVIRGLDLNGANDDFDNVRYENYPTYLYDDEIFNDVNYLLNGNILITMTAPSLLYARSGKNSTTFDEYANWSASFTYGKESVLATYERPEKCWEARSFTDEERDRIRNNVRTNVAAIARNHPNIEFYYFLTPYSIVYWDEITRKGDFEKEIETQRITIEELIDIENCYVYSWCDDVMLVCDLDNYKDAGHYGEWVNTEMLHRMKDGVGCLTRENYEDYLDRIEEIYTNYDYDKLFQES